MIRCPECAHCEAQLAVPEGEAPGPLVEVGDGKIFAFSKADPAYRHELAYDLEEQLTCTRCDSTSLLESWLKCFEEPAWFIDWWESMCSCGGEMWAEVNGESGVVRTCDRCGTKQSHVFHMD